MSSTTLLLAVMAAGGIFLVFWGMYATRGQAVSGDMVADRLAAFSGEKPLTLDEVELQKPFEERFIRPVIDRLGKYLAENTPEKQRQDMQNRLNLAGRPGNLTPADFQALRYGAAVVLFVLGLLVGLLFHNPVGLLVSAAAGRMLGFFAPLLRLQSEEMRRKRRQRAEELAAQASLKMMLPMVGCIFPTLWLILLGPAVLIIMKAKGGG